MTKFKRKFPCNILWIPVVCVSGLLISGCGKSLLFTQEELKGLSSLKDNFTVIYYNEEYAHTNSKQLLVTTHRILRVGDNVKTAPDYFAVYDGSIFKLLSFEGKVLHTNGSVETYSQSDLSSFALSNSDRISDSYARALPIETSLSPGDLIEEVEIHEQKLPELGLIFSPSQLNTRAKNITWSIELSRNDKFQYRLLHDTLIPVVTYKEGNQRYTFHWNSYVPQTGLGEFDRINPFPELLAALVYDSLSPSSWKEFGDWYLALVDKQLIADDTIKTVVQLITGGRQTNVEKLNAIFNYCQKECTVRTSVFCNGGIHSKYSPPDFFKKVWRLQRLCNPYSHNGTLRRDSNKPRLVSPWTRERIL